MWLVPEYPQRPAAHRNRPATIKMAGRISHCVEDVRAGHRNAAKGKDGARTRASDRVLVTFSEPLPPFGLRLGLCGEGLAPAMIT